ncbi:hypothetical protein GOP47_0004693 [Adiantum capillus-veneris]|uniref:Uncharacterized protein n=1 Tax=Adiantum capillus-veneris TaxID=13818 RepID=A0A9D4V7W6_ADICA|nr:hypothetical protein GOP47_0004693 [Adiantum capillus-veneris]
MEAMPGAQAEVWTEKGLANSSGGSAIQRTERVERLESTGLQQGGVKGPLRADQQELCSELTRELIITGCHRGEMHAAIWWETRGASLKRRTKLPQGATKEKLREGLAGGTRDTSYLTKGRSKANSACRTAWAGEPYS